MKTLLTILIIFLFAELAYSQGWVRRLDGRSVWSLAQSPDGTIFAGGLTGANSRIWRSMDNGVTWDTIFIGAGQTMWDFAFDDSNNIYVANFSNGLLKSTNNGNDFTLIPSDPNFNGKNLQGVACGSNGYVFVTTSTGFFRSTDYGNTFTETALSGLNCLPVVVDVDSTNIVYVGVTSATGTGRGFYRSTDYGVTFSDNLNPGKNGYAIHHSENNYFGFKPIYMATTTAPYYLDRSTDRGLTWTTVSNLPSATRGVVSFGSSVVMVTGNFGLNYSWEYGENFINLNFTLSSTPALVVNGKIFTGVSGAANGGVYFALIPPTPNVSNNSVEISYQLHQNYPNPFNPTTKIEFELNGGREVVSLKVFDISGKEISTLVNDILTPGFFTVNFDATGIAAGVYYYKLSYGEQEQVRKMVLLK